MKVEQLTPTTLKIKNHLVKIQTRKGRTLLLCDCDNASYFGHNQFCDHKSALIIYLANKNLNQNIDKLIEDYTKYKDCRLTPSVDLFLSELNKLKKSI